MPEQFQLQRSVLATLDVAFEVIDETQSLNNRSGGILKRNLTGQSLQSSGGNGLSSWLFGQKNSDQLDVSAEMKISLTERADGVLIGLTCLYEPGSFDRGLVRLQARRKLRKSCESLLDFWEGEMRRRWEIKLRQLVAE